MSDGENKQRLTFTVDFHFFKGKSYCDGFVMEGTLSKEIGAQYRMLVKKEKGDEFRAPQGMEQSMKPTESHEALEKIGGSVEGIEFIFEVYDGTGQRIYTTQFNAEENFPIEGFEADRITVTSFSWSFDLPVSVLK